MQLQELADLLVSKIKEIYIENDNASFDIPPLIAFARFNIDEPMIVPLLGDVNGDVIEHVLPKMIAGAEPDVAALVIAAWTKNEAGDRTGEIVLLTLESKTEQQNYSFKVSRNPLPVLEAPELATTMAGRLTGFMYQPTRH